MKKAAIIKDAIRNMPHVIVLEENNQLKAFPITEFGKKIAEESISSSSINTKSLPEGFFSTGLKSITPEIEALINPQEENFVIEQKSAQSSQRIVKYDKKIFSERVKNLHKVASVGIAGKGLAFYGNKRDKETIVNFKAKNFYNKITVSSLISPIKSGRVGLDRKSMEVTFKKSIPLSEVTAEIISYEIPEGVLRRAFVQNNLQEEKGISRRIARRVKSLNIDNRAKGFSKNTSHRIYSSSFVRLKRHG